MILAMTAWWKRCGGGGPGPAPGAPGLSSPRTLPASIFFVGLAWSKFWSWLLMVCLGDTVHLSAGRAPGQEVRGEGHVLLPNDGLFLDRVSSGVRWSQVTSR